MNANITAEENVAYYRIQCLNNDQSRFRYAMSSNPESIFMFLEFYNIFTCEYALVVLLVNINVFK